MVGMSFYVVMKGDCLLSGPAEQATANVSGWTATAFSDAGRTWMHRVDRSKAGHTWWLVADITAGGALDQCRQLRRGYHPRQAEIECVHQAIRCGLDFDPEALVELDAAPHRDRVGKMRVNPF